MEQSQIQDNNQQESLLWWLGGIIDGEGCITINHHRLHKGQKKECIIFSPIIKIVNTDRKLIDKCVEILRENNIAHYIAYRPPKLPNRAKWCIDIVGIKRLSKALPILMRGIITKKEQAIFMKRFIDSRLQRQKEFFNKNRDEFGKYKGGNVPYNEFELNCIEQLAKLHNKNPQRLYAEIRNYRLRNKI